MAGLVGYASSSDGDEDEVMTTSSEKVGLTQRSVRPAILTTQNTPAIPVTEEKKTEQTGMLVQCIIETLLTRSSPVGPSTHTSISARAINLIADLTTAAASPGTSSPRPYPAARAIRNHRSP